MISTFDMHSLAGNDIFQEVVRTSMIKVGPRILMAIQAALGSVEQGSADYNIMTRADQALTTILNALGINAGTPSVVPTPSQSAALDAPRLILALLASDAVTDVTYADIAAGTVDGSIRPAVDAVLEVFLQELTGLSRLSAPAQAEFTAAVQA